VRRPETIFNLPPHRALAFAFKGQRRHGHSDSVPGIISITDARDGAPLLTLLADATGYARKSWNERL
jgi:hypothetical protein